MKIRKMQLCRGIKLLLQNTCISTNTGVIGDDVMAVALASGNVDDTIDIVELEVHDESGIPEGGIP